MTAFELARANLLSPVVLCFVLGAVAYSARSDLRFPEPVFNALSIFLMLSIGLKGGAELATGHLAPAAGPALRARARAGGPAGRPRGAPAPGRGGLATGCPIPLWPYPLLGRLGGVGVADAAAI